MPKLFDAVTGKTGVAERPIFASGSCLNRKQRKFTCTLCSDVCPGKVFSLDPKVPLNWDKCTACGLCVSVCPTRCFAPSPYMQDKLTHDIDLSREVSISCYEEEKLCDKTVECLAAVPWEFLAMLALNTEIVLYVKHCSECKYEGRGELVEENLQNLFDFLGGELFEKRVHVITEGEYVPAKPEKPAEEAAMSRRDIFQGMKKGITKNIYKAAAKRLPILDDPNRDGRQYRRMLANTTIKLHNESVNAAKANPGAAKGQSYGVYLPVVTSKCYGCGICGKVCPAGAIEIVPGDDDGRTFYIDACKCSACGLCARVCPNGGIAGVRKTPVPYLGRLPLVRVKCGKCSVCGAAISTESEDGLCTICRSKKKR